MLLSLEKAKEKLSKETILSTDEQELAISLLGLHSKRLTKSRVKRSFKPVAPSVRKPKLEVKVEKHVGKNETVDQLEFNSETLPNAYIAGLLKLSADPEEKVKQVDVDEAKNLMVSHRFSEDSFEHVVHSLKADRLMNELLPENNLSGDYNVKFDFKHLNEYLVRRALETFPALDRIYVARTLRWINQEAFEKTLTRFSKKFARAVNKGIPDGKLPKKFRLAWHKDFLSRINSIKKASKILGIRAAISASLATPFNKLRVKEAQEAKPHLHYSSLFGERLADRKKMELISKFEEALSKEKPPITKEVQLRLAKRFQLNISDLKDGQTRHNYIKTAGKPAFDSEVREHEIAKSEVGLPIFTSLFHVDPFAYIRSNRQKSLTLVLEAGRPERGEFEKSLYGAPFHEHVPNSVAYARFIVKDGKLVVFELQSDLKNTRLPFNATKPFSNWPKLLLWKLKHYAKEKGLKEILLTTPNWQLKRWKKLSPKTALEQYGKLPLQTGFTLTETTPIQIEGIHSNLFWRQVID